MVIEKSVVENESECEADNSTHIPCPGIGEANNSRIPTYLHRTGISGGGARSVKVIAGELYNKLFRVLGKKGS
jgi:hypothetical protein